MRTENDQNNLVNHNFANCRPSLWCLEKTLPQNSHQTNFEIHIISRIWKETKIFQSKIILTLPLWNILNLHWNHGRNRDFNILMWKDYICFIIQKFTDWYFSAYLNCQIWWVTKIVQHKIFFFCFSAVMFLLPWNQ